MFVGLEAPVTIVISTIIHSYWTYWHQLSYRGGLALYVLLFKSCKILHSSHGTGRHKGRPFRVRCQVLSAPRAPALRAPALRAPAHTAKPAKMADGKATPGQCWVFLLNI